MKEKNKNGSLNMRNVYSPIMSQNVTIRQVVGLGVWMRISLKCESKHYHATCTLDRNQVRNVTQIITFKTETQAYSNFTAIHLEK